MFRHCPENTLYAPKEEFTGNTMHLLFLFDLELSFLSLHSKVPRESARLKTFTPCYRELAPRGVT